MMKQITSLFMIFVLLFAGLGATYAVEPKSFSERDQRIFDLENGAELRFAQLVRNLEIRVENMNHIIKRVENAGNATDINVDELERIVNAFEDLIEKVESIDTTQDTEVLISLYKEFKQEAIDLSKAFRETIAEGLTDEQRDTLRDEIKERKKDQLKRPHVLVDRVKDKVRLSHIRDTATYLGYNVDELKEQIQSGETTRDQIKDEIKTAFNALSDEEKKELKEQLREKRSEVKDLTRDFVKDVRERGQDFKSDVRETLKNDRLNVEE